MSAAAVMPKARLASGRACWLLIEGGGSRTWAGLVHTESRPLLLAENTGPSTNPRSVGLAESRAALFALIGGLIDTRDRTHEAHLGLVVAAHGAATRRRAAAELAELILSVLSEFDIHAPILVTNDVLAVLAAYDTDAVAVAVAGTGTGFAAYRSPRSWARASGLEYLLSDEGGGFDLGLQGLRAVVKAADGRGPATDLTERAVAWCPEAQHGTLLDALFDHVYSAAHKPIIAGFAVQVIQASATGDTVAARLVAAAASHIADGLAAAVAATDAESDVLTVALSGGLLQPEGHFRAIVGTRLQAMFPSARFVDHDQAGHPEALIRIGQWMLADDERFASAQDVFPIIIRQS